MVGWMDDEALHRTLTTGRATYWSRSRQEYWVKGDTSGHVQHVKSVALDCDGDARARPRRPGRRRPATPATAPASTRTCSRDHCVIGRGDLDGLAATHRLVPITRTLFADAETPVGVYRKLAGRPAGHVPARVRRAGSVVLALVVRRGQTRWPAVGGRRRGGLDRRRAGRAADERRPARGAGRGVARDEGPAAARAAAADRWLRRLPRLRRRAAHRAAAGQGGRRARAARADDAAGHRPCRGRPPRMHRRAHRERAAARRTWTRPSSTRRTPTPSRASTRCRRLSPRRPSRPCADDRGRRRRRRPRRARRQGSTSPRSSWRSRRSGPARSSRSRSGSASRSRPTADPLDVYRVLRTLNPSPYMYFLRTADVDIVGCSPEALVTVQDGRAVLHPIAGTRKRGETAERDAALAAELVNDPKEQAEHVMLVDLARNDLGRVAAPGSVAGRGVRRGRAVQPRLAHRVDGRGGRRRRQGRLRRARRDLPGRAR